MATTVDIQKLYIAYFNRPADPAGLTYWAASSMSLKDISNSFAAQKEYAKFCPSQHQLNQHNCN